jgi:hypothetical protein
MTVAFFKNKRSGENAGLSQNITSYQNFLGPGKVAQNYNPSYL